MRWSTTRARRRRIVLVDNVLEALQELAREHRRALGIPILAVAGSNGKTTTKELVSRVLAEGFEVCATQGNLNNHIGVPLTLLSMTREVQFGVVEMGASACGEIARLAAIAEPNYGILTNIGRSHLEGFGGPEGIRRGKGELYDFLAAHGGRVFVREEDPVLTEMVAERSGLACEPYSERLADGIESRLAGDYNRYNIAAAVAIGRYFDIDPVWIRLAFFLPLLCSFFGWIPLVGWTGPIMGNLFFIFTVCGFVLFLFQLLQFRFLYRFGLFVQLPGQYPQKRPASQQHDCR